jgi:uncharacterized protein (DUF2235 family)
LIADRLLATENSLVSTVIRRVERRAAAADPTVRVVLFDGTWNHPDQLAAGADGTAVAAPTNVARLATYCANSRPLIDCQYYAGPGNERENAAVGRFFGGAFGAGAEARMWRAYWHALQHWAPNDRLYVFGFSRGAAVARMFGALLAREGWPQALALVNRPAVGSQRGVRRRLRKEGAVEPARVRFMGLFDTVAAFGIPRDIGGLPTGRWNVGKDFRIGDGVERVVHLVARDEPRDAFACLHVEEANRDPRLSEWWLPGVHGNVGGGVPGCGIADFALDLMLREAIACGLPDCAAAREGLGLRPDLGAPVAAVDMRLYRRVVRTLPDDAVMIDG